MQEIPGKCLGIPIKIRSDRERVFCDALEFPGGWKEGDGYFLVKIENGQICVGYVDGNHEMNIEFRGTDPDKLIREITRRDFVDKPHAAYIAAEITLAAHCLKTESEYVQR
jgi:dihydropteroate synthase